jgi:5-carboxyvanillate decarboxylase
MKRREFLTVSAALASGAGAANAAPAHAPRIGPNPIHGGRRRYRRIATEEGFQTAEVQAMNEKLGRGGVGRRGDLSERLRDIGEGRIHGMDMDGIDMQLLLLSAPGVQIFDAATAVPLARNVNDEMAEACRRYPTRFAGLTTIAPQDPAAAAVEFERGMHKLNMKGALINSHTFDEYLDDKKFWAIFEAAEALNAPIYIHPRDAVSGMQHYMASWMTGAAWSYAIEVSTHVLRLMAGGVFDRFEKLQIVIGHMGEGIPFWMSRLDNRYLDNIGNRPKPMKRLPSEYFLDHFHITTSGMNYKEPMADSKARIGLDRILYATDYPFEKQGEAVGFAENLGLTEAEKMKFFQTNAERVFKL